MKPERIQVRYTGERKELCIQLRGRRQKATFTPDDREKSLPALDAMDIVARPDFERVDPPKPSVRKRKKKTEGEA